MVGTIADVTDRHELVAENRMLAAAVSQTAEAILVTSPTGAPMFANPSVRRLGLARPDESLEDALGRLVSALPPEQLADLTQALSGGLPWTGQVSFRDADGADRVVDLSVSPIVDGGGVPMGSVAVAREITEQVDARRALESSEARLRSVLDAMLEGVTVHTAVRDETGRIVDFRIDYSNASISAMSGIPAEAQMGRRLLELLPAHRENGLFDAYVHVVETGIPFESGAFHYLDQDAAGGPLDQIAEHRASRMGDGYVLSVRDITEQHRAEREMRHLATAIEQSSDAVVITDATGAIEYVNPAFEQVSGYTRDEVVGQNPRVLKSGVQNHAFYAAMWATLTSGNPFVADLTNRHKNGSLFEEEAVISPIHDASGAITSYVAVKRDVTRERSMEARHARTARERDAIARMLADLTILPTPAATAEAICRAIVTATGLASASLSYFSPEGHSMPLAFVRADGRPVTPRRLPRRRSRTLWERAAEGPWVEAWGQGPSHPYATVHAELGTVALAYSPIRHAGRLVGHLTVASSDPDAVARLTEVLPGLLEFGGASGALVGPGIESLVTGGLIRSRIGEILKRAAFEPVFQPIVDLVSGEYVGYEALTRFADGTRPDAAFADARSVGLEADLELATLGAAIDTARQLPPEAWLSLNISPALVAGNRRLAGVLAKADRPVVLEVTEHIAVDDYAALNAAVGRLKPPVRVAVDDAGSGIANFGHIVELRPAFVKLDIGLVRGIDADLTRQALMVGLLHFASESTGQTIAEGVETEAELATLRRLGVPFAQGYLLAKPAPAETWRSGRATS
jgi:PAS domain S-box-containing protein